MIGSPYRLTNAVTDFFSVCFQTLAGRLGRLLVLPAEANEGGSALPTGKRCRAHEMAVLVCNKRGFDFQVRRKDSMKGVVLAGGKGSRLYPLTRVTNKHLLPVYDRPMVFYPIQTLVDAGIKDIIIVTGGQNSGDFLRLLSNGKDFDLHRIHLRIRKARAASPMPYVSPNPLSKGKRFALSLATTSSKTKSLPRNRLLRSRSAAPTLS